jgi:hypothetical protein
MSRASITECEDCVEPAKAFSVVGNETRLAILEALWQADADVVRFSRLREAVGVRDSAQFNYHLQELVGQFVAGGEDGYELKYAGKAVVRALLAASSRRTPSGSRSTSTASAWRVGRRSSPRTSTSRSRCPARTAGTRTASTRSRPAASRTDRARR